MKKIIAGLATLATLMAGPAAFANVSVDVNGQPIQFDQPPVMQGGRVLVPLRGVFERLGATVMYNAATRNIQAQAGASSINLTVGSTSATVNGQPQNLDSPPILVGGRAMVPLRFVSQALGANVDWNAASQMVSITASNNDVGNAMPPNEAYRPAPPPPPMRSERAFISQVMVENSNGHRLMPGHTLNLRVTGTPGADVTFDINRQTGFPMQETAPGTYVGSYTVKASDHDDNAVVSVRLALPDGQSTTRHADQPVALGEPMGERERVGDRNGEHSAHRLIYSVVHNANGSNLHFGQTLRVTMSAMPNGRAWFDVGSHMNIPMEEATPGTYVGSYTVALGEMNPNAQVVAHMARPDGETQSLMAPPSVGLLGVPR